MSHTLRRTRRRARLCRRLAERGSFDGGRKDEGNAEAARAIYYYHDGSLPLFLLSIFAKNEKANLTQAERNEMKKLLPRLVAGYRKRMAK